MVTGCIIVLDACGIAGATGAIGANSVGTIADALGALCGGAEVGVTAPPGSAPTVATRMPVQPIIASARNRSDGLIAGARRGSCCGSSPSEWHRRQGGATPLGRRRAWR